MLNYVQARKHMVESQIQTAGVVDSRILEAFLAMPREKFVPESLRDVAYVDKNLALGEGRFLLEPSVLARMMQAANVNPKDIVLNIGDMAGFSSAMLSRLVSMVVTVETRAGVLDAARQSWGECSDCNIAVISGDLTEGCPEHAPYDLIFMCGSVVDVPDIFLAQLSLHGRLITILRPPGAPVGTAVIVERVGEGKYATRKLFDATTPYICGFEPKTEFSF